MDGYRSDRPDSHNFFGIPRRLKGEAKGFRRPGTWVLLIDAKEVSQVASYVVNESL
jgi:hypothetical protein